MGLVYITIRHKVIKYRILHKTSIINLKLIFMKRYLQFLLMLLPLLLVSCGGDDTREVTLTPSTSSIAADGVDKVTFTVKYGEDVATSNVKITANGEAITGMSFSTTKEGEYKFIAEYKGKTSKEVIVNATKPDDLILTADKDTIAADGTDKVTFRVTLGSRDVTSEAEINAGISKLDSNEFATVIAGEHKFTASYDGRISAEVIITATEVSPAALVLTVDKSTIIADNTDKAVFTVMQDGVDVTANSSICMTGDLGVCLASHEFLTDTEGEYEFYASLKDDPETKSNTVKVTAVSEDSPVLSVDKSTITADGNDEARFTVTKGGEDITDDCTVYKKDESSLAGTVFTTTEAGEYEFYASLKSDGEVKSNNVKVTATAVDVLQLSVDKTTIKGNGVEEAVFTVKLNDQDVTTSAEIYKDGVKIESNKFTAYGAGEYEFTAKYEGKESNMLKVTVQKVDLILSSDKGSITANGTDAVTFTAKLGDIDVTSGVAIKYGSTTLDSNTFTTDEAGEYEFTATLKAAESVVSNTVRIVASTVTVDELVLSADNTHIIADGQQKATFTITFNGTHVTTQAKLFKNGEEYNSREFYGGLPGDYVFQANYEYDGNFIESNSVTITVEAAPVGDAFLPNISMIRFTNNGCSPCTSYMNNFFTPRIFPIIDGHYVEMVVHADYPNENDPNLYSDFYELGRALGLPWSGSYGVPNGNFDRKWVVNGLYADAVSGNQVDVEEMERRFRDLVDNKVSDVGFNVVSSVTNGKATIEVSVKSNKTDTYTLFVGLLEDGISGTQAGVGTYIHDNTLRAVVTPGRAGESLGEIVAGATVTKTYTVDIKSGWDEDNCKLFIFASHVVGGKTLINNACHAVIDGVTPYRYK